MNCFIKKVGAVLACVGIISSIATSAFAVNSDLDDRGKVERGWYFFEKPPVQPEVASAPEDRPKEPIKVDKIKPDPPASAPQADPPCLKKATWKPECGFIDPGNDFSFQAKQRDAILEYMVMAKNDPKAVEAFHNYMNWVMERTSEVTNMWIYTAVQNPKLDGLATSPVSSFGLKLMSDIRSTRQLELFKSLKEDGAFYVFFSKNSCVFCHQMSLALIGLEKDTGLPIKNVSLDEKCLPFLKDECMTAPESLKPAQVLSVEQVPTLFLFVKPNTWLRVGTGIVDVTTLKTRTVQFFTAYRNAMLKGVQNSTDGVTPSVLFSSKDSSELTDTGIKKAMPNEDQIKKIMGAEEAEH